MYIQSIEDSTAILKNTPHVLKALVHLLGSKFQYVDEGPGSWSISDVAGHLIVCEQTNFMQRIEAIYMQESPPQFYPVDNTAYIARGSTQTLADLLVTFSVLRHVNLQKLSGFSLSDDDLMKHGNHAVIGAITLGNVLSTWAAHDLVHIGQICRIIAKQYRTDVGPFVHYLKWLQ